MKRKTLVISATIIFCLFLFLLMIVLVYNRKRENYSYYNVPIGHGKINWGMSTEEIVGILGKPASIDSNEYQDTLIYDTLIPSELGACSKLTLYIGKTGVPITKQETDAMKPGLGVIEMQIQDTTKERVFEELTKIYGELTVQNTEMERDLKKGIPDYFRKRVYSEKWHSDELSDDEYNQLKKIYGASPFMRTLPNDFLLCYMNVSGIESENTYTCNIQLDAVFVSCLLMCKD